MDLSQNKKFFKVAPKKKTLVSFLFLISKKLSNRIKKNKKSLVLDNDVNHNLVYGLAPTKIPSGEQLKHLNKFLNPRENLIIKICALVILVNLVFLGVRFYNKHLILSPAYGGEYSEGLVGYPKTINPLYAVNRDVDADLSRLIYSRLFAYDSRGQVVPDLAEKVDISPDGKEYTITLKQNVKWQSGQALTSNDVVFTFNLIQDSDFRSPLKNRLEGVGVEKIDDQTLKFILPQAYGAFLDLLTFGIMPQGLWENVTPSGATLTDLNLKPVGSGPYKFKSLVKNKNGEIKEYHLTVNPDYYGPKPYIKDLVFKFFPDEVELIAAFNDGRFDALSYLPFEQKKDVLAKNSLQFYNLGLTQVSAVFFNPVNQKALVDKRVRQALNYAINRPAIIKEALGETVQSTNTPLPSFNFAYNKTVDSYEYNPEKARALLAEALTVPAKKNTPAETATLTISLTTIDINTNVAVANMIKSDWEKIGVKVELSVVGTDAVADLIKNKNYQALLYTQDIGPDPDVYAFWSSSQPFNLAGYSNSEVDKILESARLLTSYEERILEYQKFQALVAADSPAAFLYSPSYIYVHTKRVKGFDGENISAPDDRFASINNWYIKTKKKLVW